MKIASKHIKFMPAMWWPTRRRLNFVSSGNTLQLLETALVVEGYLQRFYFPLLDAFFKQPLSEWSTVTIPYSRILECIYDPKLVLRWVLGVIFFLPALIALVLMSLSGATPVDLALFPGLLGLLGVVLTGWVCFYRLVPRHYLLFRQADGQRAIIVFRIPSRKRRLEFEAALRKNREASYLEVAPVKDAPDDATPAIVSFLVLALLFVGTWIGQLILVWWDVRGTAEDWQQRIASHLLDGLVLGLPILLVAAAIAFRHLAVRIVAAFGLAMRGVVPFLIWLSSPPSRLANQDPGGSVILSLVFHLVLALVLVLAVPGKKGGSR